MGLHTEQKTKGNLKLTRENLAKQPQQQDRGTVAVGSHTVQVLSADLTKLDVFGCAFDAPEPEIWLNSAYPQSQQLRTLVHEVVEVANSVYDLGLSETAIRILEQSVCQSFVVSQRNP